METENTLIGRHWKRAGEATSDKMTAGEWPLGPSWPQTPHVPSARGQNFRKVHVEKCNGTQLMVRTSCLALAAFATIILLSASMQTSESASLSAPATKSLTHRLARDRGCYYMLQHYKNGEQIKTDEPCLNCTCENSMLMCYLRVCPYVKPLGDRCLIERVPGECCPRITCPGIQEQLIGNNGSETLEQELETSTTTLATTTTTETTTTSGGGGANDLALSNATGCQMGDKFYPEGAQMPSSEPGKSCEVCYCIRQRAACVMQDCALEVSGCAPVYATGGCCPTRYNCSAENAFTTPKPALEIASTSAKRKFWQLMPGAIFKGADSANGSAEASSTTTATAATTTTFRPPFVLPEFGRKVGPSSLAPPSGLGCRLANSSSPKVFADGERVPSRNKCEHCYCMRNEIVCAVQECRPPCDGCVPLPNEPGEDQCCPTRYECAAPSQRVPLDNVIYPVSSDPAQQEFSVASQPAIVAADATASNGTNDATIATPAMAAAATPAIENEVARSSDGAVSSSVAPESATQASASSDLSTPSQDTTTMLSVMMMSDASSEQPPTQSSTTTASALPNGPTSESGDSMSATSRQVEPEISVMTTRQTKPPLRPISPKLSTASDLEATNFETGSVPAAAPVPANAQATDQGAQEGTANSATASLPSGGATVDGFNLNGGAVAPTSGGGGGGGGSGEREQESAEKSQVGRVEASEGAFQGATAGAPSGASGAAEMALDSSLTSTPRPTVPASEEQYSTMARIPSDANQLQSGRPLVVQAQVPGEGSCRYNGKVYQNGEEVKSKHNCTELCMCIRSVVYCDEVDCPRAPQNAEKCQKVLNEGDCCPKYICPPDGNATDSESGTPAPLGETSQPAGDSSTASLGPLSTASTTPVVSSETVSTSTTAVPTVTQESSSVKTTSNENEIVPPVSGASETPVKPLDGKPEVPPATEVDKAQEFVSSAAPADGEPTVATTTTTTVASPTDAASASTILLIPVTSTPSPSGQDTTQAPPSTSSAASVVTETESSSSSPASEEAASSSMSVQDELASTGAPASESPSSPRGEPESSVAPAAPKLDVITNDIDTSIKSTTTTATTSNQEASGEANSSLPSEQTSEAPAASQPAIAVEVASTLPPQTTTVSSNQTPDIQTSEPNKPASEPSSSAEAAVESKSSSTPTEQPVISESSNSPSMLDGDTRGPETTVSGSATSTAPDIELSSVSATTGPESSSLATTSSEPQETASVTATSSTTLSPVPSESPAPVTTQAPESEARTTVQQVAADQSSSPAVTSDSPGPSESGLSTITPTPVLVESKQEQASSGAPAMQTETVSSPSNDLQAVNLIQTAVPKEAAPAEIHSSTSAPVAEQTSVQSSEAPQTTEAPTTASSAATTTTDQVSSEQPAANTVAVSIETSTSGSEASNSVSSSQESSTMTPEATSSVQPSSPVSDESSQVGTAGVSTESKSVDEITSRENTLGPSTSSPATLTSTESSGTTMIGSEVATSTLTTLSPPDVKANESSSASPPAAENNGQSIQEASSKSDTGSPTSTAAPLTEPVSSSATSSDASSNATPSDQVSSAASTSPVPIVDLEGPTRQGSSEVQAPNSESSQAVEQVTTTTTTTPATSTTEKQEIIVTTSAAPLQTTLSNAQPEVVAPIAEQPTAQQAAVPADNQNLVQSGQGAPIASTVTEMPTDTTSSTTAATITSSPAEEFLSQTSKSVDFKPVNLTTTIPSIRGSSASITIPWEDITSSSSSSSTAPPSSSPSPLPSSTATSSSSQAELTTQKAEDNQQQMTNASTRVFPVSGETSPSESLAPSSSAATPAASSDYEEATGEEPGCEYEGKTYSSAQQIPRSHPCDFCFCFRGDIICLQQTCPPPVPHCFETVIDGFCCPRYECPVHTVRTAANSSSLTLTPYETHSRLHTHTHEQEKPNSNKTSNVRGCFVDNKLYGVGQVIESASGPCLECRCDRSGMMKCNPKECAPEDPLLQQINREVLQSTLSRSQMRR